MSNNEIVKDGYIEESEWAEAFDDLLEYRGEAFAKGVLVNLVNRYPEFSSSFNYISPYVNTIDKKDDLCLPDDGVLGERALDYSLWNAMAMVVRAGNKSSELGGHISTYASIATLYRIGFDYCFQGGEHGDLVYFQGHSSPGIYARSYLEGRISNERLDFFRQEAGTNKGLSSYPHPWLMPDYWQFPTVSMGLGPLQAIYKARWLRYLEDRSLAKTSGRKVWAFCGDGEMDEPESLGCLTMASRENLDNCIFVVNCNLQRLDGPVRSNYKVIQELEGVFRGCGWQVIKVIWNSAWDEVFALDPQGYIQKALLDMVDGQYQHLVAKGPEALIDYLASSSTEIKQIVSKLTTLQIAKLAPGGHDAVKVFSAYKKAMHTKGMPTVILAHTIKGHGLGSGIAAANATHQQKKMQASDLHKYAKKLSIPLSSRQIENCDFYHPGESDKVIKYIKSKRDQLGGYIPKRYVKSIGVSEVPVDIFEDLYTGSSDRKISTTMAFVRILNLLLRNKDLKEKIVPIVPDESRTFGMEGLFRQIGIYSSKGQLYEPVDKASIMYYREERDGQLLQEGINEAGAMSSWISAATSYSTCSLSMIPMYIYYSMFGFQRVGDLLWAAGDLRAKGFLLGATSGRTTLAGEGLQHNDGQSQLMASLIPNCVSYDPCFSYELAVIIHHGIDLMYVKNKDVFFYITLMNENYKHPKMPEGAESGIVKGMYLYKKSKKDHMIHLLGSGAILQEVIKAAVYLEKEGVHANIWSVTSFTELAREAGQIERQRIYSEDKTIVSYLEQCLGDGVAVIACSDYVKSYPDQIRSYMKGSYHVLGTDGYGRSDTRSQLRNFFGVDSGSIAYNAVYQLYKEGVCSKSKLESLKKYLPEGEYKDPTLV